MSPSPSTIEREKERLAVPGASRRPSQGLRNMELLLLVFAVGISFGAMLLVQLGVRGEFDWNVVRMASVILGLTLLIHIVLRFRAPQADPLILPVAVTLNGLGITMIYRLDLADTELEGFWTPSTSQMILTGMGILSACVVLLLLRNHRVLQRYTYVCMIVAIGLLLLPLIPGLGVRDVAARVWIRIAGFSFQPGEIAKIALAIFFAGYLVTARETLSVVGRTFLGIRFPRLRDLGPVLIVWTVCMGILVLQRDIGTSSLYYGLFIVMMFVATGRISWIVIGGGLAVGGVVILASTWGYVQGRVSGWLDAFDPEVYNGEGGSYQLVQGIFGMADGGLIGQGLGQGRPDITPLASSDFIVAALGEELGLSGVFCILLLYLLLVARGFRIGHEGLDDFGRLLATGLTFVIAMQVFIVVGGVTRVIPLTGLTTPFLASGGSSLLANWVIVAILLRLSDTVQRSPEVRR